MNESRGVWTLDGLTGGLIATGLLLAILVYLSIGAINVQHANAENFYKIKDEKSIKMFDTQAYKHVVDVK